MDALGVSLALCQRESSCRQRLPRLRVRRFGRGCAAASRPPRRHPSGAGQSEGAHWSRGPGDPPGGESLVLREDPRTGGLELLVRYPAGHVFAPHWHDANERIVLLEGRLALRDGDAEKIVGPGGYAYLPAREVQRLSCISRSGCLFMSPGTESRGRIQQPRRPKPAQISEDYPRSSESTACGAELACAMAAIEACCST
jgi:quercetin dioxygenase-like cupin family protein